jgi:chromosome segregation ATPase
MPGKFILLCFVQSLQRELANIQDELDHMSQASQQLMAAASEDSHGMIRQTVSDLNDRVCHLESRAKEQQDMLNKRHISWRDFQNQVRDLQNKLGSARQQYASLATSSLPLEDQLKEAQELEAKIKEYEDELRNLQNSGESMISEDPSVALPLELNALNTQWQDLHQLVSISVLFNKLI